MGFSHLVNIETTVKAFKARYNIPHDVHIKYCLEGDFENEKVLRVIFIPLMGVLKGEVRFPLDPLLLGTLRFYGLNSNQCLPNCYRVVDYVSQLNRLYNLNLTHHNINFQYNCCDSLKNGYYFNVRDPWMRFISCLPSSNKNSQGEFIKVSGNWLANELTCPNSPKRASWLLKSLHAFYRFFCIRSTYLYIFN